MNPSTEREPECARWNFEASDSQLLVCRDLHDKGEDCDYQPLHPAEALQIINDLRSRLLEHLARASLSTPHQAIQDLIKARDTYGWGPEVDEKINALRSLSTKPQQAGWMPIETAPKDGQYVLLWPATWNGVASCGKWDHDEYSKNPRPFWKRTDDHGRVTTSRDCLPSHWMPLPPVPGQEGGE